jgi:membrane fusion protein (multidrug efflux system)
MRTHPMTIAPASGRGGGRWRAAACAAACAALACSRPAAEAPRAQGPVEVGVLTLAPTPVALTRELPGRVSAYRVAEVRARVNGIVLKRLFTEGSDVRAGQRLFVIDPAPYRAALAAAQAQLARAEANVSSTRLQAQRYAELVEARAVSRQEYDNAIASQKAYEADVAAGRAAVDLATINLGYTSVESPVSGRIGRSMVTEGAYVQAGQATLLATVQQLDPSYVDVTQSSAELLRLKRELESGALQRAGREGAKVTLLLEDGGAYESAGELQFSDVTVDPSTGSVALRALFRNPKGVLLPGMFVRARLEEAVSPQALLVPQRAVTRDPKGGASVVVVGAEGKAELRRIEVAPAPIESAWLVTAGLRPGEQVILDGLQKARPGTPVKPVPAASPSPGAPAQGALPGSAGASR